MNITDLSAKQLAAAYNAIKYVEFRVHLDFDGPTFPYDLSAGQRVSVALSTCATIGMLMQQRFPDVPYRCCMVETADQPVRTDIHVFTANKAPQAHILAVGALCTNIGNLAAADAAECVTKVGEQLGDAPSEMGTDMLGPAVHHNCGTHSQTRI